MSLLSNSNRVFATGALVFILLSLFVSQIAFARVHPGQWYPTTDLAPPNNMKYGVLKNGLRYIILHDRNAKSVSIRMRIEAGSAQENDAATSVAPVLASLSALSAKTPLTNWVDYNQTVFGVELSSNALEEQQHALSALANIAYQQRIDDESLNTAKANLINQSSSHEVVKTQTLTQKTELQNLLALTHFEQVAPTASQQQVRNVSLTQTTAFYNRYYSPYGATIIVVGDVNYRQVKSSIKQYFEAWKGLNNTPVPRFSAPELPSASRAALLISENPPKVSIGALSATENHDSKAIRRDALLRVLGNQILEQRIIQRFSAAGITDAKVELSQQLMFDTTVWSKVESYSSNSSWRELSGILMEEINKMVEHGVTRNEFQQHAYKLHSKLEKAAKNKALQSTEYKADLIVKSVNESKVYLPPARIKSGFELHMSYLTEKHVSTAFKNAWQQPKALFVEDRAFSDSDNQVALELIQ